MGLAVRLQETGGAEKLLVAEHELAPLAAGQVRVRHTAIGLNFIDIYQRTGAFPLPLPTGLGIEAAGVVEALGDGVTSLAIGDRIAYGTGPIGAYATHASLPANRLIKLPDAVSDDAAAAIMLKGMTAHMLLSRIYPVTAGTLIVVHAAAGGVGTLLVQWAKALGAIVVGTAGSPEKRALAQSLGCDFTIDHRDEGFPAAIKAFNGGKGADVVYDGIGKDTFERSLDSLRPFGHFVGFGTASGPINGVDLAILNRKGSVYASRPSVMHHVASERDLQAAGQATLAMVAKGAIQVRIEQRFPLSQIGDAHRALESGRTTGATVISPYG